VPRGRSSDCNFILWQGSALGIDFAQIVPDISSRPHINVALADYLSRYSQNDDERFVVLADINIVVDPQRVFTKPFIIGNTENHVKWTDQNDQSSIK
jgi:hypothetical protein